MHVGIAEPLPEIRNITVALDGSENSFQACEVASIIAKGSGAKVTAVCALQPASIFTVPVRDEYYSKLQQNAMNATDEAMSTLRKENIEASSAVIYSRSESIVESLIDFIVEQKSDLVVCGTRGLGGFKRVLLGSVSSHLALHSPSSVLVVRKPEGKNDLELKRILVATDGSESASKAIRLAMSVAKAVHAKLTFVNVVYLPPVGYDYGHAYDRVMLEMKQDGEKITKEFAELAKSNGVDADTKVVDRIQAPIEAITKVAEDANYDLIVLGTRGLGGFKKLVLGSVANGVLHYAHCSVLVAK